MATLPTVTFNGAVNQKSTGNAGAAGILSDITELCTALNPAISGGGLEHDNFNTGSAVALHLKESGFSSTTSPTTLTFTTEVLDTNTMFTVGTSSTAITLPFTGVYYCTIKLLAATTFNTVLTYKLNGTTYSTTQLACPTSTVTCTGTASMLIPATAADILTIVIAGATSVTISYELLLFKLV